MRNQNALNISTYSLQNSIKLLLYSNFTMIVFELYNIFFKMNVSDTISLKRRKRLAGIVFHRTTPLTNYKKCERVKAKKSKFRLKRCMISFLLLFIKRLNILDIIQSLDVNGNKVFLKNYDILYF